MKRALITGISGFAGSHLAELLLSKKFEVYGTIRPRSKRDNIKSIESKLKLIETDIRDAHSIYKLLKQTEPEYIFHLAAQSFAPASWNAPQETIVTNMISTINIFETVRQLNIDPIIQVAGSSEEYGLVHPNEVPIKETNSLRPLNPYGVSKVGQDLLSYQYYKSYGIKTIITRAFNHTGPRHGEQFVTSTFAKQIVEIEKGKSDPILKVGNLKAKRDFTDVRDMVKAYLLAVEKCDYGEVYNICSGKTQVVGDVLNLLLSLSKVKIKIEQDSQRMRPSDVEILQGDCSKFKEKTGWSPTITFEKTMKDLLDYWRDNIS